MIIGSPVYPVVVIYCNYFCMSPHCSLSNVVEFTNKKYQKYYRIFNEASFKYTKSFIYGAKNIWTNFWLSISRFRDWLGQRLQTVKKVLAWIMYVVKSSSIFVFLDLSTFLISLGKPLTNQNCKLHNEKNAVQKSLSLYHLI